MTAVNPSVESVSRRARARTFARQHPVSALIVQRLAFGVITLWIVSMLVFAATSVLPGNAAAAVLGQTATPHALREMERQLHLNQPLLTQYGDWISGVLSGNLGHSLSNGDSVASLLGPRLANSAVLVVISGVLGCAIGIGAGAICALREGSRLDSALSVVSLVLASLPEFVVAVLLILLLATGLLHLFPAVSILQPGQFILQAPSMLVLPTVCLVLVVSPYVFRMTRGTTAEALRSDYSEMAELKGLKRRYIVFRHALPNAMPAVSQTVGIVFLYLAGGIVVVEYVFDYPGIGAELVQAVQARDIPQIQAIVMFLATFYVLMNIATDVCAILMTPRRRLPR